jgi:hypothetical protein
MGKRVPQFPVGELRSPNMVARADEKDGVSSVCTEFFSLSLVPVTKHYIEPQVP